MSQPAQTHRSIDNPAPHDLESLLCPVETEAFLAADFGRRFIYVPGAPGRFSALLPWAILNSILEQHRLEPPRLRLTREGTPVPTERFVSFQPNRRKSGHPIPRIDSAALARELRAGATLVLDNVDELHRPIRTLAESLERVFRVRIQVNSYAGWRTSHGFDLHWDDHDVFILQVAGRKHWKVYGMTRPFPLTRDVETAGDPPSEPLWEGLLQDGDLLYIPRGWWHVATPLDEPTLHLTAGINNPTGADFLSWFADRLRASETVRQDIPHLQGPAATRAYADRLREAMLEAWRPELVDEYMAHLDATSTPRPSFALPWSATEELLPSGGWTVRWRSDRPARVESAEDHVFVAALGRRWKFAPAARPLLEMLLSGRECAESDLVRAAAGLDRSIVHDFVRELIGDGLVVVR